MKDSIGIEEGNGEVYNKDCGREGGRMEEELRKGRGKDIRGIQEGKGEG